MNRKHFWRSLLKAIIPAAILVFVYAQAGATTSGAVTSQISLRAGGHDIRVEVFRSGDRRYHPAILVLHGAGGTLLDGPEMRRVARYLAAQGNDVYLLHYFETTGTLFALDSTMQKNFETWLTTVREAVVAVQKLRGDSSPVGIYGYSLGGFLSLLAASDNPHVGAVVEHAGGIWNNNFQRVGKMPPVLMIHGEEDARVPVAKYTEPLIPVLRRHTPLLETKFFPGEAHGFSQTAMTKVRTAAARIFQQHLSHQPRS